MWPYLIRKAKEGGLDVIETYVFWNAHEPQRRQVSHWDKNFRLNICLGFVTKNLFYFILPLNFAV